MLVGYGLEPVYSYGYNNSIHLRSYLSIDLYHVSCLKTIPLFCKESDLLEPMTNQAMAFQTLTPIL